MTLNSKPGSSEPSTLEKALLRALTTPQPGHEPPDPSSPATANPAVARCCQAYTRALKIQGKTSFDSRTAAISAYRQAMPPLSGHENIRDFIACVAHGILIEAINSADGARLLYAAQVAYSTRDTRARNPKNQLKPKNSTLIESSSNPSVNPS